MFPVEKNIPLGKAFYFLMEAIIPRDRNYLLFQRILVSTLWKLIPGKKNSSIFGEDNFFLL